MEYPHQPSSTQAEVLNTVLLKPAGPDCQMSCSYCFYRSKALLFPDKSPRRMKPEILKDVIRQMMREDVPQVSFIWQGGEPTLMGLSFYQQALDWQVHFGTNQKVSNSIHTNGLLLDDKWAELLRRFSFLVGLSIDGPALVHDRHRRMRDGEVSHAVVSDRAKLLLDSGVAVNALSLVTAHSARYPDLIYEHHKTLGLEHMQFIPCLEPFSGDPPVPSAYAVSAELYGKFLCRLFDLWVKDFRDGLPTTSIRFFYNLLHVYLGIQPPDCTLRETCGNYLVVEYNGDVFPCDFYVEPKWRWGNVGRQNLTEFFAGEKQRAFGKIKGRLAFDCQNCRWLSLCRGGCIRERLPSVSVIPKSFFCRSYKMFFSHADERLRLLAAAVSKKT